MDDGQSAYEAALDEVVVALGCQRLGQVEQAGGAQLLFAVDQRSSANAAATREKEFYEVSQPAHSLSSGQQ